MSRALRVLLADPDATARELTRQQLEISGGGFEILEAEDARATLCVLRAGRVDCVLIADRMAGPGGERVHTRIARSGRLPVVVIGEAWDPGDSLPALTLGAQDVLQRDELSPAGLCRALGAPPCGPRTSRSSTCRPGRSPATRCSAAPRARAWAHR